MRNRQIIKICTKIIGNSVNFTDRLCENFEKLKAILEKILGTIKFGKIKLIKII